MAKMMKKLTFEQYDFISVAKGIGIFMVVLGHAITRDVAAEFYAWDVLRNLIYTVHMPLFFLVAGFLYEKNQTKYINRGIGSFVKDKARLYMVPYFSINFVVIIIFTIIKSQDKMTNLISVPGAITDGILSTLKAVLLFDNSIDEHLWFAYVMFFVLTINFILDYMFANNTVKNPLILVAAIILFVSSYVFPMPYLVKKIIRNCLYFRIGCLAFRAYKDHVLTSKLVYPFGLAFVVLFAIYQCIFSDNSNLLLAQGVILLLIGITGTAIITIASVRICQMNGFLKRILLWLNDLSYPIYLFQQPFVVSGTVIILKKIGLESIIVVPLATVAGVIVPVFIYRNIICKNRLLRFLFVGGR